MNTLIRYSACILITGVVFASGYALGQHQATEQGPSLHQQDLSTLISESTSTDEHVDSNKTPRRKPALLM